MPSNDTANIYSSEYRNGGTPSTPTTAADVAYDNTTSGLTADNVQEAIDELASGIGTLEETVGDETAGLVKDVNDLQEEVTNATNIVIVSDYSWDSAIDGNKSFTARRMGHLVFVTGYFESSTLLTQWQKIVTGLPKPLQVATSSDAATGIDINIEADGDDGALVLQNVPQTNTRVRISLVYLA